MNSSMPINLLSIAREYSDWQIKFCSLITAYSSCAQQHIISGNSCWILMTEAGRRQLFIFVKIAATCNCGAEKRTRVFSSVFLHAMKRRQERLHPNCGISLSVSKAEVGYPPQLYQIHLLGWVWVSLSFSIWWQSFHLRKSNGFNLVKLQISQLTHPSL